MIKLITTRDGTPAEIDAAGESGRFYGRVPGVLTATSWFSDGRHDTFPDYDIQARDLAELRRQRWADLDPPAAAPSRFSPLRFLWVVLVVFALWSVQC